MKEKTRNAIMDTKQRLDKVNGSILNLAARISNIEADVANLNFGRQPKKEPEPTQDFNVGDYVVLLEDKSLMFEVVNKSACDSDVTVQVNEDDEIPGESMIVLRPLLNETTCSMYIADYPQYYRHLRPEEWIVEVNGVRARFYRLENGGIYLKALTPEEHKQALYHPWEQKLFADVLNSVPIMPYELSDGDYKYSDEM